jgi:hypothetical protein
VLVGLIRGDKSLQGKEEALAEAAIMGNIDNYPLPIISRMFTEYTNKSPSASQIAGGAYRRSVLERIIPFYARPRQLMAMLRGTLIHAGLQGTVIKGTKVVTEVRVNAEVPGTDFVVSGQVDVYYPEHRRLEDYKTCQNIPSVMKEEHVFQLAVYCWLLRWNGYQVDRAVIDYLSWDDVVQIGLAEMADGTINDVMIHPYFKDEETFIRAVSYAWSVLNAGYEYDNVPSMQDCKTTFCRYCPVKWACDRIDPYGEFIKPEEFVQESEAI